MWYRKQIFYISDLTFKVPASPPKSYLMLCTYIPGKPKNVLKLLMLALIYQLALSQAGAQGLKSTQFDDSDMAGSLAEARSFQKYPTYDQYVQLMQQYAAEYPSICRLDTLGYSVEGRLLLALKISDQVEVDEAEAAFLYTSTMHGDEIVGIVLLLRFADLLLRAYGSDTELTRLVDQLEIWINPIANPDGCYSRDDNLSLAHSFRYNLDDVDLNRDFPIPNKDQPDDPQDRAIETQHMMGFMKKQRFTMSANIHSGMEVVNYPWDNRDYPHVDSSWYRFVSGEYADEAMAVDPDYMFGWPEGGIVHGYSWYQAAGTRQDYINYYLGGREVTLELSMVKRLESEELERHWDLNERSLINYMAQATYGIRGRVSDQNTGEPLLARIEVLNHDKEYDRSWIQSSSDHGDYYRLIKEGMYDLRFTAEGYYPKTLSGVQVTDYQATFLDVKLNAFGVSVEDRETPGFRIYPNPAVHRLMVEPEDLPHGDLELTAFGLDGKVVLRQVTPYHGSAVQLSTSQLQPGIYLLRCTIGSNSQVLRLMVFKP